MGHYDNCRKGYCSSCGAAPGNMTGGVCEFCSKKRRSSWAPPKPLSPAPTIARPRLVQDNVIDVLRGKAKLPKKSVANKLDIHIFKDGSFTIQTRGREVAVGSGGRKAADYFVEGFLAKHPNYKVQTFVES